MFIMKHLHGIAILMAVFWPLANEEQAFDIEPHSHKKGLEV